MLPRKIKRWLHYFLLGYLAISLLVALWVPILWGKDYLPRLFNQFIFVGFGLIEWEVLHTTTRHWIGWLSAFLAILSIALIAHFSFTEEDEGFLKSFATTLFGVVWFNVVFWSISQNIHEYNFITFLYSPILINIAGVYFLLIIKEFPIFNDVNNQKMIIFSALITLLYFTLTHFLAGILVILILKKEMYAIPLAQLYALKFCLLLVYSILAMLLVNTVSRLLRYL